MHQSKQIIQTKPQFQQQPDVETQEAIAKPPTPLTQQISRMSNVLNPSSHAAMLNRFPGDRASSNPQFLLQLQRQYGNRYVNQVLQQAQRTPIQTKLTLGAVGDKYEQEADRISKQVVNQINTPASQLSTQSPSVQRQEMLEEDELMMKPIAQRQSSETDENITPELETSIQQEKGSGQPLAENIRKPMEQAFGANFSAVKVHTDPQSDRLNQSIQAQAFTTGQDIFFRQGTYNPDSRGGQELVAHELTHVVQQGGKQIASTATEIQHSAASESGEVIQRMKLPKLPFRDFRYWLGKKTGVAIGGSGREGAEEHRAIQNVQIITPTNANNNNRNLTPEEQLDEYEKAYKKARFYHATYQSNIDAPNTGIKATGLDPNFAGTGASLRYGGGRSGEDLEAKKRGVYLGTARDVSQYYMDYGYADTLMRPFLHPTRAQKKMTTDVDPNWQGLTRDPNQGGGFTTKQAIEPSSILFGTNEDLLNPTTEEEQERMETILNIVGEHMGGNLSLEQLQKLHRKALDERRISF